MRAILSIYPEDDDGGIQDTVAEGNKTLKEGFLEKKGAKVSSVAAGERV